MNLWCLQSTILHFFEKPQKNYIFSKNRKDLDWTLDPTGGRGVARFHFFCGFCPYGEALLLGRMETWYTSRLDLWILQC